jgi:hypothetical protein
MTLGILDLLEDEPTPKAAPESMPTTLREQVAQLRREPPGPFRDALREVVVAGIAQKLAGEALASLEDKQQE